MNTNLSSATPANAKAAATGAAHLCPSQSPARSGLLLPALSALGGLCAFSLAALVALSAPAALAQSPAPAPAVTSEPQPKPSDRPETVITSDELDMVGGEDANHFFFRRNVRIQATNMLATCDEMEVVSGRQRGAAAASTGGSTGGNAASAGNSVTGAAGLGGGDSGPNIGSIREIIMRGNVVISQEGRRATAGKATLYPQDGRVVLEDNPRVTDSQGTLSGWRMELNRGERTVKILSNPNERTKVTLPSIGDLGFSEMVGSGDADKKDASAPKAGEAKPDAKPAPAPSSSSQPSVDAAPAAPAASATPAATATEPAGAAASQQDANRGWNPVSGSTRRGR